MDTEISAQPKTSLMAPTFFFFWGLTDTQMSDFVE